MSQSDADPLAIGRTILAAQPFSVLVGTIMTSYGDGAVELRMPITERVLQHHGFVHGGVVGYLADNALTFAAGLAMGGGVLTAEMKINYLRPAEGTGLIARGSTLRAGRVQAVSRCEVYAVDEQGRETMCAAAQGTVTRARGLRDEVT